MTLVVSLRDFVGEMQALSDDRRVYLNKVNGEFIMIFDDDLRMAESDIADELLEWPAEPVQDLKKVLSSDDYLELPSTFDIHEYEIMERFCLSVQDQEISDVLLGKIKGSGAFRRFKDTIYRYGIEQDWFRYRDAAYKEIAISWLEAKGIACTDDLNVSSQNE
jgi:myo-inositol catabolism protein IolC